MRLIVLAGKPRVGKTHALELLKKVNDGTIDYFQDDVRSSDIFELLDKPEKLGVITTQDRRVIDSVPEEDIYMIHKDSEYQLKFLVSSYLYHLEELDWTEAFHWLRLKSDLRPKNVDEFFNFICK